VLAAAILIVFLSFSELACRALIYVYSRAFRTAFCSSNIATFQGRRQRPMFGVSHELVHCFKLFFLLFTFLSPHPVQ